MGQTYECWARSQGALLSLPHGARTEDVINTKLFEDYIRDNVVNWFHWSNEAGLPVERMEDLILVTGCTLARSWAAAARSVLLPNRPRRELNFLHYTRILKDSHPITNVSS